MLNWNALCSPKGLRENCQQDCWQSNFRVITGTYSLEACGNLLNGLLAVREAVSHAIDRG